MKILLLLACLVPLALAKQKEALSVSAETAESVSSSEESIITHSKEKLQKIKHEEQQQRQAARQAPAPYAVPVCYTMLAPSLEPVPQPEMMAAREAALPRGAPALVSVPFPFLEPLGLQIPAQPLLQPAVPQLPQSLLLPFRAAQLVPEPKAPRGQKAQHGVQTQGSSQRFLQLLRALQTPPAPHAPHAPEYVSVAN